MHKFSIPVDIADVEKVLDDGFIADFSKIKFDRISDDQQLNTAFLYFRNTGFNFIPDFSNCNIQRIAEILETYLSSEYDVPNIYLENIWLILVLRRFKAEHDISTKLSEESLVQLDDLLAEYIDELVVFINSLPAFGLFIDEKLRSIVLDGSLQRTNFSKFGANLYNILSNEKFNAVIATIQSCNYDTVKFYNMYFTEDNVNLIKIIRNISTFGILSEIIGLINEQ